MRPVSKWAGSFDGAMRLLPAIAVLLAGCTDDPAAVTHAAVVPIRADYVSSTGQDGTMTVYGDDGHSYILDTNAREIRRDDGFTIGLGATQAVEAANGFLAVI